MAPFSRIQATAAEVSSPPENAMPTRSPIGSEVRTVLMPVTVASRRCVTAERIVRP